MKLVLNRIQTTGTLVNNFPYQYKVKGYNIVYVAKAFWILAQGYSLYKYIVATKKLYVFCKIPDKYAALSRFKLTRRLFRAEVRYVYPLKDGTWLFICKKVLYKFNPATNDLKVSFTITNGSRPMMVCVASNGSLYFGDYYHNIKQNPINIYRSQDNGMSWEVCYTFPQGTIRHVHGVFEDPYSENIWVATGDLDAECIFGYTVDDFKSFHKEIYGSQHARVCNPLFYEDRIVFATDSQYEQNYIKYFKRGENKIETLCKIQGSGIYSQKVDGYALVSTTVEPSEFNHDKYSHLWISTDREKWTEIAAYKKDCWHNAYFQFGSIRFPEYEKAADLPLVYFGRAVCGIDQSSIILSKTAL